MSLKLFGRTLASILFVSVSAVHAVEQSHVVLLDLAGDGASAIQAQISEILANEHHVSGQRDWNRVAARLAITPSASKTAVARLAPELRARAVVSGEISPRGKKHTVVVTVRDGKTGASLARESFVANDTGFGDSLRRKVATFLARAIAKGRAGEPTLPPEPEVTLAPSAAPPRVFDEATPPPVQRETLVDATVRLALFERSFDYDGDGLRNYSSSAVGGFGFAADIFPLAQDRNHFARRFGLALSYAQVFTLTSTDAVSREKLSTTLREIGVGLRYRYVFGSTGFLLNGLLGYGHIGFTIDWEDTEQVLPNAAYHFVQMGIGGELPLGSLPMRALLAMSGLVLAGQSGDLEAAGGSGFDLQAGIQWISGRFGIGPHLHVTRITVNEPATLPAGAPDSNSATDQYLEFGIASTFVD